MRLSSSFSLHLVQAKLGLYPKTLHFPSPTPGRKLELLEAKAGDESLSFFITHPHNLGKLPAQLGLVFFCVMVETNLTPW